MIIDRIATASLGTPAIGESAGALSTRGISSNAASVDFTTMLGDLAASATSALKTAETTSLAAVQGQATVQQVVEAVMTAEQTLQSSIAIRDKVVGAYLELSHMQI
jgi:flagellar hook-basal body complex protein FliE